jgi:hypothetical protein
MEGAAASLGAYLKGLSGEIGEGRVFVFMTREYYETRFSRILPALWPASAPLTPAGGGFAEGPSLFSPGFRGIGLCFYEDIPKNLGSLTPECDILFCVEPRPSAADSEGVSREEGYFDELQKIKTRLRLGVLNHPGIYGDKFRRFFSLRGKMKGLEREVIRDANSSLRLPRRYGLSPRKLRRPPCPFREEEEALVRQGVDRSNVVISGGARLAIQAKFNNIRTPEFKEEQRWFFYQGKEVPYTAYAIRREHDLDFNRLKPEQRDYFFWWRGEFRRGNPRKTSLAYILLYTRELILSMGGEEPLDNFRELLRLWRIYREEEGELDPLFPPWLMDFVVLYKIADRAFPEMIPREGEPDLVFLRDFLLHKRYIEADNPLVFADFEPLLFSKGRNGPIRLSPPDPLLTGAIETGLRGIDGFLRKKYGKRLLEFFYPPHTEPVLFPAFERLPGVGNSSYSVEWIGFYYHRPLLDFLAALANYIEYKRKVPIRGEKKRRAPILEEVWKDIIDRELGFQPDQNRDRFGAVPRDGGIRIELEPLRITRLRAESDEVREMLRIDDGSPEEDHLPDTPEIPPSPIGFFPLPELGKAAPGIAGFLEGLDEIEGKVLWILSGKKSGDAKTCALRELTKNTMTMPELLIDGINERFQGFFQDILIEIMDGEPQISAEYGEDIRGYFAREDGKA